MHWKLKYALFGICLGLSLLVMNVILHETSYLSLLGFTSSALLLGFGLGDLVSYLDEKKSD